MCKKPVRLALLVVVLLAFAFILENGFQSVMAEAGCAQVSYGSTSLITYGSGLYGSSVSFGNPNPGYDFYGYYDVTFYNNGVAVWSESSNNLGGAPYSGNSWVVNVQPPMGTTWNSTGFSATDYNSGKSAAGSASGGSGC